jgi:hypothetical protein
MASSIQPREVVEPQRADRFWVQPLTNRVYARVRKKLRDNEQNTPIVLVAAESNPHSSSLVEGSSKQNPNMQVRSRAAVAILPLVTPTEFLGQLGCGSSKSFPNRQFALGVSPLLRLRRLGVCLSAWLRSRQNERAQTWVRGLHLDTAAVSQANGRKWVA